MFALNKYLLNINYWKNKLILGKHIFNNSNQKKLYSLSVRQQAFEHYKKRYENYEHIFYSSYLDLKDVFETQISYKNAINKNLKQNPYEENVSKDVSQAPKNWMEDYEHYNAEASLEHSNGTEDPTFPASNVPCNGCGAILHCNFSKSPGFLPSEIFKGRTESELKSLICKRCHFLKCYNQAIDIEVSSESYIRTISSINDKFALAVVIVDLLDFPCSIWPEMNKLLGSKRPIFIVGNKVDLLPRDDNNYLNHVKSCLEKEISIAGFDKLNVKNVSLISAKTGYGIEELITQLQKNWAYKGDVYLMGCTNVGKSSLFNILLNSDYCRPETTNLIRKSTTSPWPGTTLSMLKFPIHRPSDFRIYERFKRLNSEKHIKAGLEKLRIEHAKKSENTFMAVPSGIVGRTFGKIINDDDMFSMSNGIQPITTFNENGKNYKMARWVYDTPGVMHPDQITDLLNTQELKALQPNKMISPRAYRLKPGMSLLIAGLSRLDFVGSNSKDLQWIKIFLFASFQLPTMIVDTSYAADIYGKYIHTPLMKIPMESTYWSKHWPGLQCYPKDIIAQGRVLNSKFKDVNCSVDITLSSTGWVGLQLPIDVNCVFRAWTPNARGIYLRTPSLVPYADRLIGNRLQNSLAYNISKPFTFSRYKKKQKRQ